MNRSIVLAEWRRAAESLGAAQSCLRDGFCADSVSRAYYSILHAAKAALQFKGISAESHAAVSRLFGPHLVKTGLVGAEWGSYLGETFDVRLTADYDVETHLTDDDARDECDRAGAFMVRIRGLLLASSLSSDELRTQVLER